MTISKALEVLANDGRLVVDVEANPGLVNKLRVVLAELDARVEVSRTIGHNLRPIATITVLA